MTFGAGRTGGVATALVTVDLNHMRTRSELMLGVVLLTGSWCPAAAQLLWPGPQPGEATRAFTFGFAMNHGGVGIGYNQAIPHTPFLIGVGGSPFGYAAHVDLGLPELRHPGSLPSPEDGEGREEKYVSAGLLALPRHQQYAPAGYWLFEFGLRDWPRGRRGLYLDGALGVMRWAYGDRDAFSFLPLPSFRFLVGFAF